MNLETIKAFAGDPGLYGRGLDYYNNRRVVRYSFYDNRINASVQGSSRKPYYVLIDFSKSGGEVKRTICGCPYPARPCKHIIAVLVYHYERTRPVVNPIVKEVAVFKPEQAVELLNSPGKMNAAADWVKGIEQAAGISVAEEEKPRVGTYYTQKKYRLVFVISRESYIYGRSSVGWALRPELQYVKQNGTLGSFVRYKTQLFSASSPAEKEALLRIAGSENIMKALEHHLEFLLKSRDLVLFLQLHNKYLPVHLEEIKNIILDFRLARLAGNEVCFAPVFSFAGVEGALLEGISGDENFAYIGTTFAVIPEDGRVFFRENCPFIFEFLRAVLRKGDNFTYPEIEKLKKYFSGEPEKNIRVNFDSNRLKITHPVPKAFMEISRDMSFRLMFDYSGRETVYKSDDRLLLLDEKNGEYVVASRNTDYEDRVHSFLINAHREFIKPQIYSRDYHIVDLEFNQFLVKYGLAIIDQGIEIRLKGEKARISRTTGRFVVSVGSGIDWLDLAVSYSDLDGSSQDIRIDRNSLYHGLVRVGGTYKVLSREDIKKLEMLQEEGMKEDGTLRVSKYRYDIIDELYSNLRDRGSSEVELIRNICSRLKNFEKIESIKLPRGFNSALRKYQQAGYNWLYFLYQNNLNGCLADDMGLGKTVQALSLLRKLKEEKKLKTALIVVPVTTLSNWESEIKKWAPDLTYLLYFGAFRKKKKSHLKKHDLIAVSYHTLRNDIELFNELEFTYVVLDEAQYIKNAQSQAFKAIRTLKAEHRLSLTGTPIENNTLELWAQMDFLNPGLLGGMEEFRQKFARPIEIDRDKKAVEKLKARIFPFLLRRKKEEVMKELPEKTEIVLYSEMGDEQERIYNEYREYYRELISGKIEKDGVNKSAIEIFAALMKLRQIALFPGLADKKHENVESCKYEHLKDMLEEILEEDHKVLIFSQFLEPLAQVEKFVQEKKWKYSYLTGASSAGERKAEIERFQQQEEVRLFLLSLRAGGIGINLTAADYVILFDPWWNPAVEQQAIDRTHRIGQTRKVLAYKMITKGTVEEKILELQEKKKNLVREIISSEAGFFKSLSKSDILNLFK